MADTKQGIKFKQLENARQIKEDANVTVTQMQHIIEVRHVTSNPHNFDEIVKVDKDHYVKVDENTGDNLERVNYTDTKTGEDRYIIVDTDNGVVLDLYEYEHTENRSQNIAGVKRTMKTIRNIINNNFSGEKNELFITLTYKLQENNQPMNDTKKASKDFDNFIKRFKRRYKDIQYLAVLEPQANTAWHWHILIKFTEWGNEKQIHIDNNSILEPLWGHGFTKVKALNNVDNIGAYLSAYLGDVEITDTNKTDLLNNVLSGGGAFEVVEKEVTNENGEKQSKKYIKGARLHLYPNGCNIYRCSKGIEKPVPEIMQYSEVKKIVGTKTPDFSRTVQIVSRDKDERQYNAVTYEQYNMKRTKKQYKKKPPRK